MSIWVDQLTKRLMSLVQGYAAATVSSGGSVAMAAVMARNGATTCNLCRNSSFKDKFTKEERATLV